MLETNQHAPIQSNANSQLVLAKSTISDWECIDNCLFLRTIKQKNNHFDWFCKRGSHIPATASSFS